MNNEKFNQESSNETTKEYTTFLNLWFLIHLLSEAEYLSGEAAKQAIFNKFGDNVSCIEQKDRIIGISCKKDYICNLLKQDSISPEVISTIRNLPIFSPDDLFTCIWEKNDGVQAIIKENLYGFANKELLSIISNKKKLAESWLDSKYLSSQQFSPAEEFYLVWNRAICLFTRFQDALEKNLSILTNNQLVTPLLQWTNIILKALEIEIKHFSPSEIIPLVDWVTYNGSKQPTVALDNLNLVQFMILSVSRAQSIYVYSQITKPKEILALNLILKLIKTLSNFYNLGWQATLTNKISSHSPTIGEKTAIYDFCQNKSKKIDLNSRKILVIGEHLFSDIASNYTRDKNPLGLARLALTKTILKIDCLSDKSNWNFLLYDQDCITSSIHYTNFSNLHNRVTGNRGNILDLNAPQANCFQSSVRHFFWSENFIDRNTFAKAISDLSNIDNIINSKGIKNISRNNLFSSEIIAAGKLNEFVDITRGQVLKTNNESFHIGLEINPGDISESGLINYPKKIITNLDKNCNEKYKIKKGDILIGVKGLVGKVGFVDQEVKNWYAGQAVAILRSKKAEEQTNKFSKFFSQEYIFLNLKSKNTQNTIVRDCLSKQSKSIDMSKLRSLLISFPEISMDAYRDKCKNLFYAWREFQKIKNSIDHLTVFDNNLSLYSLITPEFAELHPEAREQIEELTKKLTS